MEKTTLNFKKFKNGIKKMLSRGKNIAIIKLNLNTKMLVKLISIENKLSHFSVEIKIKEHVDENENFIFPMYEKGKIYLDLTQNVFSVDGNNYDFRILIEDLLLFDQVY